MSDGFFLAGRDRGHGRRLLCHRHAPGDAAATDPQRTVHGDRHRGDALYRHGGDAHAGRAALRSHPGRALGRHRDRGVDRSAVALVPHHGRVATHTRRGRHGLGHFGHALHRHGGGRVRRAPAQRSGARGRQPRADRSRARHRGPHLRDPDPGAGRLAVRQEVRRAGCARDSAAARKRGAAAAALSRDAASAARGRRGRPGREGQRHLAQPARLQPRGSQRPQPDRFHDRGFRATSTTGSCGRACSAARR